MPTPFYTECGCESCKCKPAKEVCYSGPALTCLGIDPKDTIDVALQKINTFLCGQSFIDLVNAAIDCQTILNCTTTTTTINPTLCQDIGVEGLVGGGSWIALDCLGVSVGGDVDSGTTIYTGCINYDTLELTNAQVKDSILC